MKNIKRFLFIAILGIASGVQARPDHGDYKNVVQSFINSRIHTDYASMKAILSKEAVEKLPRLKQTYKFPAAELLKVMRSNNGVEQQCIAGSEVLAESDAMVMVRVDFSYQNQVVSEFLTLERNNREDWKVTQINKFFSDASRATEVASASESQP